MASVLRPITSLVPRRSSGYGAKARHLAALQRAGVAIPFTYALSASVCRRFLRRTLPGHDWVRSLLSERTPVSEARLAAIRARIEAATVPVRVRHDIREFMRVAGERGVRRFAVRSSALHEDAAHASAAGLHSSFMNLVTEQEIFRAVLGSWASLYHGSVLAYLSRLGEERDPAVGLIFQEFVSADSSGVLFTVNPVTGDAREMMLNAVPGLCMSVTDGSVSPDILRIDRASGKVRDQVIGDKRFKVVPAPGGGIDRVDLADDLRSKPTASEGMVRDLAQLGVRVEGMIGSPQDIEWVERGGRLLVVQSRPVTFLSSQDTTATEPSLKDRSRLVWSNVNVGEALPGVVTPLTWSVLSRFADLGFKRAFAALGCTVPKDAELFGNFRGRIYLNLTEFIAIASQVPGIGPELIVSLGGGTGAGAFAADLKPTRDHRAFFARLPFTVARFVSDEVSFRDRSARFEADFAIDRRRLLGIDPRVLSPVALDRLLWDAERVLHETGGLLLSSYGRLLIGLLLLRALLRMQGEEGSELERRLLAGFMNLASSAPAFELGKVLEYVADDASASAYLRGTAPADLAWASFPEGPGREAVVRFLAVHGYRGPREAELMQPRWREQPELILSVLRVHLLEGRSRLIGDARDSRSQREAAETLFLDRVALPLRPLARRLLERLESLIVVREQLRAQVTEILGAFRAIALDASRRLATDDPAYGDDAAFFLTVDELHAVLSARVQSVVRVAEQRRRQHGRDEALADPPSTFLGSPPAVESVPSGVRELEGLPASGGYITGRVRVAQTPADVLDLTSDEILVVARADVGWSPFFTVARAVVTELGGPLSHAAIVLREYGVPAVVNVPQATRILRTGDRVVVDGDRGRVTVLERAPDADASADGQTS
ncbi:MAG: hypothetical protein KC417_11875 [Myxococcales bacterium]|nr:hypothetical protein [Myxococcales bacterium]